MDNPFGVGSIQSIGNLNPQLQDLVVRDGLADHGLIGGNQTFQLFKPVEDDVELGHFPEEAPRDYWIPLHLHSCKTVAAVTTVTENYRTNCLH